MPEFAVEFAPAAARDLKRLDTPIRVALLKACTLLSHAPFPSPGGAIKLLVGVAPRHFRLRVGDYRVIYRIEGSCVVVVRVAHRREAYR
ncbi:MAG: type II toxin-antitoxin system RelE/ParE family toxin [Candidatus Omnitrophica bacterium]|nr:type II toxin-antitoxin system RelE/ParE family toxin [Candidatus Omnitrophota bacterium]